MAKSCSLEYNFTWSLGDALSLKDSSRDLQLNYEFSFCFHLYLMCHACVVRYNTKNRWWGFHSNSFLFGPCLVPRKFCKIFQILRHIKSLDAYIKY